MALSGCRGGAIGAAVTLGVLGISVIDLIFGLTPVRPAEVIVILSNGLLSGTAMGAALGILIRLYAGQSNARIAVLGLGAAIGLLLGPVVLMLTSSIGTLFVFAVLKTPYLPDVFDGMGGCVCGPVIGLTTGLLIAGVTVRRPVSGEESGHLDALKEIEHLTRIRTVLQEEHGIVQDDLLVEARTEWEESVERVWRGGA